MQIKNTATGFGMVSILLHWIMAILMIGLLLVGLYMTRIPFSSLQLKLFRWHKEWGMLVLALVIVRLGWRLSNPTPILSLPFFEKLAARSAHWMMYTIIFILPITGWILTSASGISMSFFGLFVMPDFVLPNETIRLFMTSVHQWVAYFLILILCLHISASLKHHFINKDDILRRMLWPLNK